MESEVRRVVQRRVRVEEGVDEVVLAVLRLRALGFAGLGMRSAAEFEV